jgi:cytochrome P450
LFDHIVPVPADDIAMLFERIDTGTWGTPTERPRAFQQLHEYCNAFLARRATEPARGDVIDAILAGVVRNGGSRTPDRVQERDAPASFEDKSSVLLDVIFGGLVTTTHVMCAGMHYLATHPESRRALAEDPLMVPQAVEEFIRYYQPTIGVAREVMCDVQVAETKLEKGDIVMLNFGAANRDPNAVEHPGDVDIRRSPFLQMSFGVGPHRCMGSHLARLNLRVAIEEFLRRIPEFEVKPGTEPTLRTWTGHVTMGDLHLIFPPGGGRKTDITRWRDG